MDARAVALSAGLCLLASPYLARLTLTVPDRENHQWWQGKTANPRRTAVTAAVALGTGALAGAAAGWSVLLPAYVALALAGAPLTIIDVEHHRLPNRLVYPAAGAAAVLLALAALVRADWPDYLRAVLGSAAVFAVLYAVHLVGPFGRGDVRLGGILGGYLGWQGWLTVYFGIFGGFVLGSVVSVGLLVSGRASRKTPIPFGPMLLYGALIVLAFDLTPSV